MKTGFDVIAEILLGALARDEQCPGTNESSDTHESPQPSKPLARASATSKKRSRHTQKPAA